jgi:tetratricopeptide (TPR) repeat protein
MLASRKLAGLVQRRLRLQRWVDAIVPGSVAALSGGCVALALSRLLGSSGELVALVSASLCGSAFVGAWLRLHPAPGERSAAAMADDRLSLESRISTALALHGRTDAFAQAAVADGERVAPGQFGRVRAAFPLRWPALAPWVPAVALVAGMAWWLWPVRQPSAASDAATVAMDAEQQLQQAQATEQGVREAVRLIEESPEAEQALQDTLAELERKQAESELASDPARREAEASERAAALQDRLERELDSEAMRESRELADLLARLPELPDAAKELSQALKSGDLDKAKAELERLAGEAAGKDPAKAKAAQQALDGAAKALEQAARSTSAAEQALREAGMDPKLAQNMQQAMQAAQQNQKLTPQQRQELQKKLQSCQNASQQCQNLSKSTSQCKSGSSSEASSQLSRAQAQRRMQAALSKAMGQCRNGSSMGWSMPWERKQASAGAGKSGSGGKGGKRAGQGGSPRIDGRTEALPEGSFAEKQESAGDGDPFDRTAAREFVRGEGVAGGKASDELKAVAAKVEAGLEEGTEEDPVPGRLKEAHKRYFEQWKRRLDGAAPAKGGS